MRQSLKQRVVFEIPSTVLLKEPEFFLLALKENFYE